MLKTDPKKVPSQKYGFACSSRSNDLTFYEKKIPCVDLWFYSLIIQNEFVYLVLSDKKYIQIHIFPVHDMFDFLTLIRFIVVSQLI